MSAGDVRATLRIAQFILLLLVFIWLGTAKVPTIINVQYSDLILHASGYAVAVLSAYVACVSMPRMWLMLSLLWLFSFIIEVIQHYLSWRSFSVLDFMANGSGILAGFIVLNLVRPIIDQCLILLHLWKPVKTPGG